MLKGGTHGATGPVIICVIIKEVGSTAFSATSRQRRSTSTCTEGGGRCGKGGRGKGREKGTVGGRGEGGTCQNDKPGLIGCGRKLLVEKREGVWRDQPQW